LNSINNCI